MQLSAATSDDSRVFVLAATNRVEDLDPALLRRFDRCLRVSSTRSCPRKTYVDPSQTSCVTLSTLHCAHSSPTRSCWLRTLTLNR